MKCFHHNDLDGESSAAVVAKFTGDTDPDDYIAYNYEAEFPQDRIEPNEQVYIVDLSFSEGTLPTLQSIMKKTDQLTWIDHHASSIELIQNHPELNDIFGTRNSNNSAAVLCWQYMSESPDYDQVPTALKLVSSYDTWKHDTPMDREFKFGCETIDWTCLSNLWTTLLNVADTNTATDLIELLINKGIVIKEWTQSYYEDYRKRNLYFKKMIINGKEYSVPFLNHDRDSDAFGPLFDAYPMCVAWIFDGTYYRYSFYSNDKSEINCKEFAEKHGGGGHVHAAGVQSKEKLW